MLYFRQWTYIVFIHITACSTWKWITWYFICTNQAKINVLPVISTIVTWLQVKYRVLDLLNKGTKLQNHESDATQTLIWSFDLFKTPYSNNSFIINSDITMAALINQNHVSSLSCPHPTCSHLGLYASYMSTPLLKTLSDILKGLNRFCFVILFLT